LRAGQDLKQTFDTTRQAIQGEVAGPGWKALLKNNPYSQILIGLTPDEAQLNAANKKMLGSVKNIFPKPTEREIFLLLNSMLPSIGKSREANEAGLAVLEKANDLSILYSGLVDKITKGGTKYVPDLEAQVFKKMKPITDQFRKEAEATKAHLDSLEIAERPSTPKNKRSVVPEGKIRVRSPDGRIGTMTQEQINAARDKNVIFTPVE